MTRKKALTPEEKETYQWQLWVPDFGEEGQVKLKNASVLVSRCGGLGSVVAYELAAAGIGKLVLAHAGNTKPSDLNRQLHVRAPQYRKHLKNCLKEYDGAPKAQIRYM